ncbi:hypothetical protein CONLIGDRAFT_571387 [Coniochaeta ligniaria NRRL 30616]|uniref:RRN7-type domain-containing protein n=1 Tax=Coniochaeta ligniaria NRRL 30616 TaxID=1408157 RepID=A0A1J7IXC0_9PEZI|nr:hypothetical protein CONLIGDRAFT_571387 [Coniochaeta ligniaria NRRL 30616]
MEGRELRRFPKGQTCSECPAKRYYQESGFRYCQNGHRVEGFIEYDVDLEGDNYGKAGTISRKTKEKREKQHKHLSGNAARELYLECLQLVLRKQLAWLVRERGLPAELETVVRDLWDLRVRNFGGLRAVDEKGKGKGRDAKSEPESGSESEMLFSSQGETDGESGAEASARVKGSRIKNWAVKEGQKWPMPRLLDTLALCYLGCLAMRLPVRIGDLLRWARSGRLLLVRAIADIPVKMRDRLQPQYKNMIRGRYSSLTGGEFHTVVTDLVMGYQKNFDMVFPPLNTPLLLLRYLRELALPLEAYVYAEKLVSLLRLEFSFSTAGHTPFKDPETLLIASIVLAVKLLYPFEEEQQYWASKNDRPSLAGLSIDWTRWAESYLSQKQQTGYRRDFETTSSADVYDMTSEEIDSYLDWYQETQITADQARTDNMADVRDIDRLFPLDQAAPPALSEADGEEDEAEIETRIEEVREHISWARLRGSIDRGDDDDGVIKPGKRHWRYQSVEDLNGPAKVFHEKAAEYSGLSLDQLLQAVFRLEQKLLYWQQVEKGGIDIDEMVGIEEGVPSRAVARLLSVKESWS